MNATRYIYLLCIILLSAISAWGQELTFDHSEWDFGTIKEVDGVVSHTFSGVNATDKPIVITRISTSCGCTSTDHPTKPIAPDERFEIQVSFDPAGRPDDFSKSINVILNGDRRQTLIIKGVVTPRPRTVEDDFPYYMIEGLRLSRNSFGFGTIQNGGMQSTVVEYVNTSQRTLHPKLYFEKQSGLLKVELPQSIAPNERGQINIMYDLTKLRAKYGRLIDKFGIEIGGKRSHHTIYTAAIAIDNFDEIDYDTAPVASFSCRTHDFGTLFFGGQKVYRHRVTLTNKGDDPLIIRWIENKPQHFFITLPVGTRLEKEESVTFDMVLQPDKYGSAEINDAVSIITNDPIRPYFQLKARAKIKME